MVFVLCFVSHQLTVTAKNVTVVNWYQLIEYKPTEKKIEGIPIGEFDTNWSSVLVLNEANFFNQPDLIKMFDIKNDIENMKRCGYVFSKEGDFNKDGVLEKALVGVYQDKHGQYGRFLLVLEKNSEGHWHKASLSKVSGKTGFSVLSGENDNIDWSFSIKENDDYYTLLWSNGQYELRHFPRAEHSIEYFLCSIRYKPTEETIADIPVKRIDESWDKALVLSKDNFLGELELDKIPIYKEDRKTVTDIEKHGYHFSREGDFNNDGIKDKALVGIYQDKSGKIGSFLLVITESASQKWHKDFLVKIPSEKLSKTRFCAFSVLAGIGRSSDPIQWSSCTRCDTTYILVWENDKYTLKYFGDYLPTVYKSGKD